LRAAVSPSLSINGAIVRSLKGIKEKRNVRSRKEEGMMTVAIGVAIGAEIEAAPNEMMAEEEAKGRMAVSFSLAFF